MKSKIFLAWSMVVIVSILLILILVVFIPIKILFTAIGGKVDKYELINKAFLNLQEFEQILPELNDYNEFIIKKDNTTYIVSLSFSDKKIIIDNSNEYQYRKFIKFMKKFNINEIEKNRGNIAFSFEKGMAQVIASISNMDEYKRGHSINYIENIDSNWYYIELN